MAPELAQIASGWPLAASMAAAVTARGLIAGRRRTALNEALHELRRPLQALVLATPATRAESPALAGSVRMATAALERLDREINGRSASAARAPFRVGAELDAAVERWRDRAALAGGSLRLRRGAEGVAISGDRAEFAQALDNLIINSIEHGGPHVVLAASLGPGVLRVLVIDSGRGSRRGSRRPGSTESILSRISGRRRHGHGLRVVRRIAAAHGGDFRLRCSETGTEATLVLPLLGGGGPA
jgi:signal transduction histidine kinase